jgi:multidrug resistance efflux pump
LIAISEAQLGESRATLEQIANEIAAEESEIQFFKIEYDRGAALHVSGAIAELELVRRRSRYYAQKSKIEAVRQRHAATKELIAKNEAELIAHKEFMRLRTEERRKLDRAQAAVTEAEAALKRTKTSLAEARLKMERMEVRSPIDGMDEQVGTRLESSIYFDNPDPRVLAPRSVEAVYGWMCRWLRLKGGSGPAGRYCGDVADRNFSGP